MLHLVQNYPVTLTNIVLSGNSIKTSTKNAIYFQLQSKKENQCADENTNVTEQTYMSDTETFESFQNSSLNTSKSVEDSQQSDESSSLTFTEESHFRNFDNCTPNQILSDESNSVSENRIMKGLSGVNTDNKGSYLLSDEDSEDNGQYSHEPPALVRQPQSVMPLGQYNKLHTQDAVMLAYENVLN